LDLPVADIKFDDATRIRKDLDEESLLELIESFKNVGQITPIVVTRDLSLIAGRRRLEAARRLEWSVIRAEYLEDLPLLQRKIVEYDENAKRHQLTWQEAALAIKEIHDLERAAASSKGSTWTASDTARALGVSLGKVSEDLTLASAMGNERVASRPSRIGAISAFKRERELDLVRELARRRASALGLQSRTENSTTLTGGVVYNLDCRELLRNVEPESIDLIIIDPPWGIDFDKSSQWTKKWVASYDDSEKAVQEMLLETFPLLYKVLKPAAHIYCFYPIQESQWWVENLTSAGFAVRQRPLVWFKVGQPSITDTYTNFLPCYESILWGYKPNIGDVRRLFARPVPEAQGWPREPTLWHENSKPVEMLQKWIESSSEINEVVLDVFAGGGSTLAAAFSLGRYYIGCELDEVNYKKCVDRLRQLEERKDTDDSQG
jgi:ParB/RepB/Spo0J family partition protein